jgi:hypothetical protein
MRQDARPRRSPKLRLPAQTVRWTRYDIAAGGQFNHGVVAHDSVVAFRIQRPGAAMEIQHHGMALSPLRRHKQTHFDGPVTIDHIVCDIRQSDDAAAVIDVRSRCQLQARSEDRACKQYTAESSAVVSLHSRIRSHSSPQLMTPRGAAFGASFQDNDEWPSICNVMIADRRILIYAQGVAQIQERSYARGLADRWPGVEGSQ